MSGQVSLFVVEPPGAPEGWEELECGEHHKGYSTERQFEGRPEAPRSAEDGELQGSSSAVGWGGGGLEGLSVPG